MKARLQISEYYSEENMEKALNQALTQESPLRFYALYDLLMRAATKASAAAEYSRIKEDKKEKELEEEKYIKYKKLEERIENIILEVQKQDGY